MNQAGHGEINAVRKRLSDAKKFEACAIDALVAAKIQVQQAEQHVKRARDQVKEAKVDLKTAENKTKWTMEQCKREATISRSDLNESGRDDDSLFNSSDSGSCVNEDGSSNEMCKTVYKKTKLGGGWVPKIEGSQQEIETASTHHHARNEGSALSSGRGTVRNKSKEIMAKGSARKDRSGDKNLRKAVAEYDTLKGTKNELSMRAIAKKWEIPYSTFQRYACKDESKRLPFGSKSGRKRLLTDEEFEKLHEFTANAEQAGKELAPAEVINKMLKIKPDLDLVQAGNYYQNTFKKRREKLSSKKDLVYFSK